MLRPRFHTAQSLAPDAVLTLEAEPSRHIAKALRMRTGDRLCLFDGHGVEAAATITAIERDAVTVELGETGKTDRESPLAVTLAIALSRGDRFDTVVQKATELGVHRIWPLHSERTGVKLDAERLEKKRGHWQRVAVSACEQCGRNRLPEIASPTSLTGVLSRAGDLPGDSLRLVLHPGVEGALSVSGAAPEIPEQVTSLALLVGPEGGFSDAEVGAATAAGFRALELGPRVLRTETAPLAAIAAAQLRWGDFVF